MEENEVKSYLEAGKIASKVKKKAEKGIKPGQKLLEIADSLEKEIIDATAADAAPQGKPAFPVNLSVNENAAHQIPSIDEKTLFLESDVLKVDIGVQVDGYIADCAFTLDFSGKWQKMIEASREALDSALKIAGIGASISGIGETIEKKIKSFGFNPVYNLSGHTLQQYSTHNSPSIPNYAKRDSRNLEEGNAYAIEPFATNGKGFVKEGRQAEIFSLKEAKPARSPAARKILAFVQEEYNTLPFAERWIARALKMDEFSRKTGLRELIQKGCLETYPVLHEEPGCIVTQAETTILLNKKEVIVLVE